MIHDTSEQVYYVYGVARPRGERPGPLPDEGIVPGAPVYALTYRIFMLLCRPSPRWSSVHRP